MKLSIAHTCFGLLLFFYASPTSGFYDRNQKYLQHRKYDSNSIMEPYREVPMYNQLNARSKICWFCPPKVKPNQFLIDRSRDLLLLQNYYRFAVQDRSNEILDLNTDLEDADVSWYNTLHSSKSAYKNKKDKGKESHSKHDYDKQDKHSKDDDNDDNDDDNKDDGDEHKKKKLHSKFDHNKHDKHSDDDDDDDGDKKKKFHFKLNHDKPDKHSDDDEDGDGDKKKKFPFKLNHDKPDKHSDDDEDGDGDKILKMPKKFSDNHADKKNNPEKNLEEDEKEKPANKEKKDHDKLDKDSGGDNDDDDKDVFNIGDVLDVDKKKMGIKPIKPENTLKEEEGEKSNPNPNIPPDASSGLSNANPNIPPEASDDSPDQTNPTNTELNLPNSEPNPANPNIALAGESQLQPNPNPNAPPIAPGSLPNLGATNFLPGAGNVRANSWNNARGGINGFGGPRQRNWRFGSPPNQGQFFQNA